MAGKVSEITDASFEAEVLKAQGPVLVDFWAPWCSPCKAIAPILDSIATTLDGKLKICKVNTDQNPRSPNTYGVRQIPNLILFKGGQVVEQIVGARLESELLETLKKHLD